MKRIFSCLLIFLGALGLVFLVKGYLQSSPKSGGPKVAEVEKTLAIHYVPGQRFVFSGLVVSEIEFSSSSTDEAQQERFKIAGDVVLQTYQKTPEGMLWGISLERPELAVNHQHEAINNWQGTMFFLRKDGDVTEFFLEEGMDTLYVNVLKSMALALQLSQPADHETIKGGISWDHQEPGRNGVFDVEYRSLAETHRFMITKEYRYLRNTDGMKVGQNSYGRFEFAVDSGRLSSFDYKMTMKNQSSSVGIVSRHALKLEAVGFQSGLGERYLLSELQNRLPTESPDQEPLLTAREERQYHEKLVRGISPEAMLESVGSVQSLEDENIPQLLLQLEVMVALDKEFSGKLLDHLDKNIDQKNFSDQLSLIMGAISSMDAGQIEGELLEYSQRYQDNEDITQQTAFALAELNGASEDVYHFFNDLNRSPNKNIRTIGLLSLGTLGQQADHATGSSSTLVNGLREAEADDKTVYLAALSNTKNPYHLDLFASYLESGEESHMEQALFGLKHIPGERAFFLIREVVLNDSRERLVIEGLEALAGHIRQPDCGEVLMQAFHYHESLRVKMAALSTMAAVAPLKPRVQAFLKEIQRSAIYDRRIAAYAGEILLTI
jgi:hypothetical protein